MTFVVPFDGSDLAEAALVRASEFSTVLDERVLAVSAIPKNNAGYAREHGWLEEGEPFEIQSVVGRLHEQVTELAPESDYRHVVVGRFASSGAISNRLSKVAREEDASMVFIGSQNAGRLVTGISSVGGAVASSETYDVVIIRNRAPSRVRAVRESSPHRKSDFY